MSNKPLFKYSLNQNNVCMNYFKGSSSNWYPSERIYITKTSSHTPVSTIHLFSLFVHLLNVWLRPDSLYECGSLQSFWNLQLSNYVVIFQNLEELNVLIHQFATTVNVSFICSYCHPVLVTPRLSSFTLVLYHILIYPLHTKRQNVYKQPCLSVHLSECLVSSQLLNKWINTNYMQINCCVLFIIFKCIELLYAIFFSVWF